MSCNSEKDGGGTSTELLTVDPASCLQLIVDQDCAPLNDHMEQELPSSVVIKVENEEEINNSCDIGDPLLDPLDTRCGSVSGDEITAEIKVEQEIVTTSEDAVGIKEENEECPDIFGSFNGDCQELSPGPSANEDNESLSESEQLGIRSGIKLREVSVRLERVDVKLAESVPVSTCNETPVSSLVCSLCSFTFEKYRELEEHLKFHFSESTIKINAQGRSGKRSGAPTSEIKKIFPCNTCGKGYTSIYYLKNTHKCTVKRPTDGNSKDDKSSSRDETGVDVTSPSSKTHACPFCGLIVSSVFRLCLHMSIHTGIRSHCCKVCGKAFATESHLSSHNQTHTRPFVCKICGKKFAHSEKWKKHYMSHPGANPFCCPQCGITFSSQIGLNQHGVLHKRSRHFPCSLCDQVFSTPRVRTKHNSVAHADETFFPCVFCGKNFFSPSDLHRHMQSFHDNDKSFRCYLCRASFLEFDFLRKHFGIAHKEMKCPFPEPTVEVSPVSTETTPGDPKEAKNTFYCKVCAKGLSSEYSLKNHMTRHKQMESFFCFFCKKPLSSYRALIAHVTHVHKKAKKQYSGNTWNSSTSFFQAKKVLHKAIRSLDYSVKRRKLHPSDELSGQMLGEEDLHLSGENTGSSTSSPQVDKCKDSLNHCEDNLEGVASKDAEPEGERVMTHSLSEEQRQVAKESFRCDVCKKSYSSFAFYEVHRRLHSKIRLKKKFDGRKLSSLVYNKLCLADNVNVDKLAEKSPLVCLTCGKMFKRADNLRSHELIHTGETPFGCSVCGKRFSHSYKLRKHERIHTGETPFCCSVCGKRFRDNLPLLRHMMKQHGKNSLIVAGKSVYSCETCGKAFFYRYMLKRHQLVHSGSNGRRFHSCQTCGKTFMYRSYLTRHERLHSGENTCNVCGKSFSFFKRFQDHMKTHAATETSVDSTVAGGDSSPSSLVRPSLLDSQDKIFTCNLCGSTYSSPYSLKYHIKKKHKHAKSCTCQVCIIASPLTATATSSSVEKGVSNFENSIQEESVVVRAESKETPDAQSMLKGLNNVTEGPFRCDVCGKSFSLFGHFKVHRRIHSTSLPLSVKYTALSRSRNIMVGRREATGGENSLAVKHQEGNELHMCTKCGREFSRDYYLRDHESVHIGVTPFSCSTCGATFRHSNSLKKHTKQYCDNYLLYKKKLSSTVLDQQTLSIPPDHKSFSCTLCGSRYLHGGSLKEHMLQVHEHDRSCSCQDCSAAYVTVASPAPETVEPKDSMSRDSSSKLSHRARRELFSCSLCPQTFSSSSSLEEHVSLSHETPKSFRKSLPPSSGKCNGGVRVEEPLRSNLNGTQLPSTPVAMKKLTCRCDLCGETYESGNALSQHYRSSHKRTKTFHCDMCGKEFSGFEYYSVHLRLHMGEQPFCCEVCGGSFSSKSNLTAHKVRAHSRDEKPFVCAVCGEAFSEKSHFKMHCMEHHSDIFLS